MAKISQMVDSKYLKQADVEDDTVVTVKKVGQANIAKDDAPPDMKWLVRFAEFEKPMVLNRTNISLLGNFLGDDTDDWIGKQVIVYNDESIQFQGKVTGGLRFKRLKAKAKNAAPTMEDEDATSESDQF